MTTLPEVWDICTRAEQLRHRTVVPGIVIATPAPQGVREQDADFLGGVGDLIAGIDSPGTQTPGAPVLNLTGGGFYCLFPVVIGDEALGLVSDRSIETWRTTRLPGQAPPLERIKDDSDTLVAPLAISAPAGAPTTWDGLVLGGPAGAAIDITTLGEVTITKAGVPISTITMDASGSVTIEVITGQSVNLGGPAALALAKAQDLLTALDGAITAAVAAAAPIVPPAGDGGTAAFTAFQATWNGLKNNIAALKAKGE